MLCTGHSIKSVLMVAKLKNHIYPTQHVYRTYIHKIKWFTISTISMTEILEDNTDYQNHFLCGGNGAWE